ncbi:cell division protein ZapA [bacterium]|nr:cell division protein ZapA [bacterium]
MEDSGRVVKVTIFGQSYPIRARVEDEGYVRTIAQFVDSKMKEIDETMKPSSTMKVAILTALNIADELMSLQKEREKQQFSHTDRLEAISSSLDEALKES